VSRRRARVGDVVRLSPECGPNARRRFGDRTGVVVQLNRRDDEIGVAFTKPRRREDGTLHADQTSWFLGHELVQTGQTADTASVAPDEPVTGSGGDDAGGTDAGGRGPVGASVEGIEEASDDGST